MEQNKLSDIKKWVKQFYALGFSIEKASSDASFRSYYRIISQGETKILMDAPPKQEPIASFLDVTKRLTAANLNVPIIYEKDEFCLITEKASENINIIHHRQPVILNEADVNRYLNLELSGSNFLKECKKPDLIFHEVSKDVNNPTNNTASLIQAI